VKGEQIIATAYSLRTIHHYPSTPTTKVVFR